MKSESIKICATSDLHGHLEGIAEAALGADVVVIAGDIQPALFGVNIPQWYKEYFFPMICSMGCEVVVIPGNHDFHLSRVLSAPDRKGLEGMPCNLHLLTPDSGTEVKGVRFWGTPWVPLIDGRWCFEGEDSDLSDRFNQMPEDIDVLIAHSPPKIPQGEDFSSIDVSMQYDKRYWKHFGSASLYRAIERKRPKVLVCGHIHSGEHMPVEVNDTICLNVSRLDEHYDVAYIPTVFSLKGDRVVLERCGDKA